MYILKCQYCGQDVKRTHNRKKVTCFDCTHKRVIKNGRELLKKRV